jgi:lipopolysaccharide export system protein LptA
MFSFEPTVDLDVSEYEYELYEDALGAVKISSGKSGSSVFTIDVETNSSSLDDAESSVVPVTYYGRIRPIDTSGNAGPWTPSSGLKESSATALIDGSHVMSLTAAKITAGTINAHEIILKQQGVQTVIAAPANMAIIRSSNYNGSYSANATPNWTQGTSGWVIGGNGYAEFDSAVIRGTIKAGAVWIDANNRWNTNSNNTAFVNEFKVGSSTKYMLFDGTNLTLTGNVAIGSGNSIFKADENGIYLGNATFASAPFRVTPSGALTASGVDITGTINATSGTFSGNITSNATITGGSLVGAAISGSSLVVSASGSDVNGLYTNQINIDGNGIQNAGTYAGGTGNHASFIRADGITQTTSLSGTTRIFGHTIIQNGALFVNDRKLYINADSSSRNNADYRSRIK